MFLPCKPHVLGYITSMRSNIACILMYITFCLKQNNDYSAKTPIFKAKAMFFDAKPLIFEAQAMYFDAKPLIFEAQAMYFDAKP